MRLFKRVAEPKQIKHHPMLAIDFENDPGNGLFKCAGVFGEIAKRKSYREGDKVKSQTVITYIKEYFTDLASLHEFLLGLKSYQCTLTFFNLSYDKWFLHEIVNDAKTIAVGTRIIKIALKNRMKGFDLTNYVKGSLADWIGYLNMTEKYGVYKAELDNLEERVMNDAEATYHLACFLEDFFVYQMGIPLQYTIGQSGFRLIRQRFFTDFWWRPDGLDWLAEYEREGFYGGRCEVIERGEITVDSYDLKQAYVSAMRDCLYPDPATAKFIENGSYWKNIFEHYLGIYHCKVRAPKQKVMILPFRHNGKLIFPYGEFIGKWTTPELKLALEYGYEVLECYDFVFYRQSKPYFKKFAEFLIAKRAEYEGKGNVGMIEVIKTLGNSVYGKFAQRNDKDGYWGKLEDAPELVDERPFKFYELPNGETWVSIQGTKVPAQHEFPVISAFISAYTRCRTTRAMKDNEQGIVYCDTDNVKVKAGYPVKGMEVGNQAGMWKFLGTETCTFYRPKYTPPHTTKGIPKRATITYQDHKAIIYQFEKPLREREAIKRNMTPNQWITVEKELSLLDDKRIWAEDNTSEPIPIRCYYEGDKGYPDDQVLPSEFFYKTRMLYGARDTQVDYPEYDWQNEADELALRRSGEMIYQRGKW